jgi:Domain of unknown function (DUF4157)
MNEAVSNRGRAHAVQARPGCTLGAAAQLEAIGRMLNGGGPIQLRAAPPQPAGSLPGRIAKDVANPFQPPLGAANRTGLPDRLKASVEALSGLAMDDVWVHGNSPEPAKLGALAYTQGSDIHLGPGQERHLPHEVWHVVQQKQGRVAATGSAHGVAINESALLEAEADRVASSLTSRPAIQFRRSAGRAVKAEVCQKKDPPGKTKAPTQEESETKLGTLLRSPQFAGGYALAFYDEGEPEAQRRAADFATRENALGFSGKGPSAATAAAGLAIAGVFGIETTTLAIAGIVAAALARVPPPPTVDPATAAAAGKIRTIAIFAHGTPTWCSAGVTVGNAAGIFTAIAPKLASNVTVILYTCNSARGTEEDEEWVKGTMDPGGKGSLAELVRDTLLDQKVDAASVWGHTTTGHTSRNPALRVFEARAGKDAPGESYVSKFVFTDTEHAAAAADIATVISELGYSVTATDPKFVAAAARVLRAKFYQAYIQANKNLEGVNVAEDAPNHPYLTASRVVTYWTEKYWPAQRNDAAKKVVAAMKLKKPGTK